jgi:hypothetical protein
MTRAQAERQARREIRKRPQGGQWIVQTAHPTDYAVIIESYPRDYWRACEAVRQARAEYVDKLINL